MLPALRLMAIPPALEEAMEGFKKTVGQNGDGLVDIGILFLKNKWLHSLEKKNELHLEKVRSSLPLGILHGDNRGGRCLLGAGKLTQNMPNPLGDDVFDELRLGQVLKHDFHHFVLLFGLSPLRGHHEDNSLGRLAPNP